MHSLDELRKSAGLSQRELAKRVGLSHAKYGRMEQGKAPVPDQRLTARLAGALGVDEAKVYNASARVRAARRGLNAAVHSGDLDSMALIAQSADVPYSVRKEAAEAWTTTVRLVVDALDEITPWLADCTAAIAEGKPLPKFVAKSKREAAKRAAEEAPKTKPWTPERELYEWVSSVPDPEARAALLKQLDRQPWSKTEAQMRRRYAQRLMKGVKR